MKGFVRPNPLFSLCGLNCGLCSLHLGGHCPGCGGGEGNQSCALARCSLAHGMVAYCCLCPEYPCEKYRGFGAYDSFITCRCRDRDFARFQSLKEAAYMAEQAEKVRLLALILERYNDGRRKTFFSLAVYLFDLEDIKALLLRLDRPEIQALPIKERALHAVGLFDERARELGVVLKLNKKKK